MALWILRPRQDLDKDDDPWDSPYNKCHGFIIRATTEGEARIMANFMGVDEKTSHRDVWIDSNYSTCEELHSDGLTNIIMMEFINE